jgi:hypothetical protein
MKTFSDLRQNLTESELLSEESYQYGEIYDRKKFNPENPEILVKGVGRVTLEGLKKNLSEKFKDLSDRAARGADWGFIKEAISEKGILNHYILALLDVERQLKNPVTKRRITLMKKEEDEKKLRKNIISEVAPPDAKLEDWILKNKKRFIEEYGKQKGLEILYAKAWSMFKEKK